MTTAGWLDALGTRYGKLPHELLALDPAEFAFDMEVLTKATAK